MVDSPHPGAGSTLDAGDEPASSVADEPSSLGRNPRPNARTCVGCGRPAGLDDTVQASARQRESEGARRPLVRLVIASGEVAVDSGNGSFGRGAYVHAEGPCVAAAAGKGLARAAKSAVTMDGARLTASALASAIRDAYERRAKGLMSAAKRAGRLEAGADAAALAIRAGDAALVIVAADAGAARELTEVRKLVAEGKVLVWGDKQELSQIVFGQPREAGVGVVVVTDTRIAGALRESRMIVEALAPSGQAGFSPGEKPRRGAGTSTSIRGDASKFGAASASILGGGAANLRGPGNAVSTPREGATGGAEVTSVSQNQGRRKNA